MPKEVQPQEGLAEVLLAALQISKLGQAQEKHVDVQMGLKDSFTLNSKYKSTDTEGNLQVAFGSGSV